MRSAIHDLPALVERVHAEATHPTSVLHGPQHWQAVADVGQRIVAAERNGDPLVVFLFGLLHDVKRLDDGHDPDHGPRSALELLPRLVGNGMLSLTAGQHDLLTRALCGHTGGTISDDPTIGACWDADRLCLWRVEMTPDPQYLSTGFARDVKTRDASAQWWAHSHDWTDLFGRYAVLTAAGAR